MKAIITLIIIFSIFSISVVNAQEQFIVEIEPLTIDGVPNIHSFSWGKTSDGKWLILGGRIDGLHMRQPIYAFLETYSNKNVFVIDPGSNQVWSTSLSVLAASIYEQLQSTNQEFYQRENTLYVIGGYGFSATQNDHVSYPNLTAIDVDGLANAIVNSTNISPFFRQITDDHFAVTGGQLGYLDSTFYLCGGNYFEGRYNPLGPDFGDGFIQTYTDEIRKFEIDDDDSNISITNYTVYNDPDNLHRRDYNMAPQIFPDGEYGFTMFSGVFQVDVDLPFLNSVDITGTGYTVNNDFTQYLSQYHSAKIPVYDSLNNTMHTIFFGGMSQYKLDVDNNLTQDDNVPFVKTISKVSRFSDGSMIESKLDIEMPTLLGSGAEFIPLSDSNLYIDAEIVNLNKLSQNKTLIGYIYGGIESSLENIFFINDGTQSSASNQIFKVYFTKSILEIKETFLNGDNIFNLNIYPNPSEDDFSVEFFVPNNQAHYLILYNILGTKIQTVEINKGVGENKIELNLSNLPSGQYILLIKGNSYVSKKKLLKL